MRRALQRAQGKLGKAVRGLSNLKSAVHRKRAEEAMDVKASIESNVMRALGVCINPDVPTQEAAELAYRAFFSKSVTRAGSGRNAPEPGEARVGKAVHMKVAEQREMRQRVEGYAAEVLKARTTTIPSEEIVSALSQKGWDAEQFATAWANYLTCVFEKGSRATLNQKREALKLFTDWKRSLEPKAVIEVDADYDAMSDEELKRIQRKLIESTMQEYHVIEAETA